MCEANNNNTIVVVVSSFVVLVCERARMYGGAAVAAAATVIFKNTIRQWQCIFTLVGQMIPVNGLLSPARTHTARQSRCTVHSVSLRTSDRVRAAMTMTLTVMYLVTHTWAHASSSLCVTNCCTIDDYRITIRCMHNNDRTYMQHTTSFWGSLCCVQYGVYVCLLAR